MEFSIHELPAQKQSRGLLYHTDVSWKRKCFLFVSLGEETALARPISLPWFQWTVCSCSQALAELFLLPTRQFRRECHLPTAPFPPGLTEVSQRINRGSPDSSSFSPTDFRGCPCCLCTLPVCWPRPLLHLLWAQMASMPSSSSLPCLSSQLSTAISSG